MRITVATYNIHACVGADGRFDPERIAKVVAEIQPHVVALQEVEHYRIAGFDLLDHLADATRLTPIAGPTLLRDERHYGNALLTRLPILSVDRIDLSLPRREPRGAVEVELDWQGRRLKVVATHLGLKPGERRQQTRRLLSLFDALQADVAVLLGDLNEWLLWGRPLRWLRRRFPPTPLLRTYPARFPLFALDRIWVWPEGVLSTLETHDTPLARVASDHRPLKATLALSRRAENDEETAPREAPTSAESGRDLLAAPRRRADTE